MNEIQKFSESSLATIEKSNFLPSADLQFLKDKQAELQATYEKRQIWRTETEMRVGVLSDHEYPTNAAKYWQCIREQSCFYEQLIELSFEYRKNEVKIAKLERIQNQLTDDLDIAEAQIEMEQLLFSRMNMEVYAKDRIREIKLWEKLKVEFNDGTFDTNDVNQHQLDSYVKKFNLQLSQMEDIGFDAPTKLNHFQHLEQVAKIAEQTGQQQLFKLSDNVSSLTDKICQSKLTNKLLHNK